jgi:hypothetical protein
LPKEHVEAEWVDYPTAERYSGLSHVTLWRRVKSGELKAARVGACGFTCRLYVSSWSVRQKRPWGSKAPNGRPWNRRIDHYTRTSLSP